MLSASPRPNPNLPQVELAGDAAAPRDAAREPEEKECRFHRQVAHKEVPVALGTRQQGRRRKILPTSSFCLLFRPILSLSAEFYVVLNAIGDGSS